MDLLRVLTLIYAGVLVLALAVSLIAIWVRLRGIDRALERVRAALDRVRRDSEGLEPAIAPLREDVTNAFGSFEAAAQALAAGSEAVRRSLEPSAAGAGPGREGA